MKKSLILLAFVSSSISSNAQLIMKVEMKVPVEGICDNNEVYALFNGFKGQVEPKCTVSKAEMEQILNDRLQFLKNNPKFKGKGMVGVYINCKGETIDWEIDSSTKNEQLDQEILAIFKTFTEWSAGKLDGKAVDTRELISYEIKKGKIILN